MQCLLRREVCFWELVNVHKFLHYKALEWSLFGTSDYLSQKVLLNFCDSKKLSVNKGLHTLMECMDQSSFFLCALRFPNLSSQILSSKPSEY